MKISEKISDWFLRLFSIKNVHKIEVIIVAASLAGFLIHLLLIFLNNSGILTHPVFNEFSGNYMNAIYTPFSFLLIYEVFLFLYYLPKSFTKSIGKHYEIISLIVLRRIFKDISHFDLDQLTENISQKSELLIDMAGVLVLFFLIAIFYHLKKKQPHAEACTNIKSFVVIKRLMSLILLPVLIGLAIFSFGQWFLAVLQFSDGQHHAIPEINNVFYDTFFSILIYVDVFILIISFLYTRYYSQLMRNSGFIISTVLIRLSFTASPLTNIFLILASVLFGVLILLLYNFFIKVDERTDDLFAEDNLSE